ncbi:YSIRK-type signal peptide-containing protein [Limosilactobacillus urinaemulieris]|uniref:YSIRK-type signal peptide-containing protein n=1 Tax=Limosilactobacillus urinaemulieris TaxID=2742600 RepID=UPI0024B95B31|nr:YSIRK-type signal peptide-containing protein [Limosilactobacillus urinaemulieris]
MLSSNNWKEQIRKQEPKKQRFTLKKLTVGVASVLIGFTFMGIEASANTTTGTVSKAAEQPADTSQADSASIQTVSNQAVLLSSSANSSSAVSLTSDADDQADDDGECFPTTTFNPDVPTNVHKTSDSYVPDVNKSGFTTIVTGLFDFNTGNYRNSTTYKLNADGTEFVNTTDSSDSFPASAIKYSWVDGYKPNTNFGTDTATVPAYLADGSINPAETRDGELYGQRVTFSKYRIKWTVMDPIIAQKFGDAYPVGYSDTTNVYFNFYGAQANQPLNFKQNSDISNLTQAQYRQLVDVTDLGANAWNGQDVDAQTPQVAAYTPGNDDRKTFTMVWAPNGQPTTATIADGVKGTVRINFNDGTYLDVPVTITDKNGKNPVTVTYPDGSHDTATAKVFVNKTVDPTNPEYKDMFKTVTRDIVTTPVSGQQITDTQNLDFGRSMTIYGNGQASTYGKWKAGKLGANGKSFATEGGSTEFALKDIPQADGYTSYYKIGNDGQKVIATAVSSASALDQDGNPVNGTTVYVGYDENDIPIPTPTEGKVVISYADKNNPSHILGTTSVGGINGSEVNVSSVIKNNVPANWKIEPAYTIPTNSIVPDTINVPLIHETKTITPTDHDDADMFKTVTRTIEVNNPGGTVNTTT